MRLGLFLEIFEGAADRGLEEREAGHAVVEHGGATRVDLLQEAGRLPVATKLGIVPAVATHATGTLI